MCEHEQQRLNKIFESFKTDREKYNDWDMSDNLVRYKFWVNKQKFRECGIS